MEAVGFTRDQAEALAREQASLIDERLATKMDIAAVRADSDTLRAATKVDRGGARRYRRPAGCYQD